MTIQNWLKITYTLLKGGKVTRFLSRSNVKWQKTLHSKGAPYWRRKVLEVAAKPNPKVYFQIGRKKGTTLKLTVTPQRCNLDH